jgi:CheY-like chemotaxis protein
MKSLTDFARLEARDTNARAASVRGLTSRRKELRILVVEDNTDAADLLAAFIELHGHEVRVLYRAPETNDIVAQFAPDILFIDIELPQTSGCEFLQQIRMLPQLASSRFIAFSGYCDLDTRRLAKEAGFHKYLVKPCNANVLIDLIDKYVASA